MFEHLLLAVDFSKHSATALQMAAAICEGSQRRLTVLTVWDPTAALPFEGVFGLSDRAVRDEEENLHEAVAKKLSEFCLPLDAVGLHSERLVKEGPPARTIVETAKRMKCDLIVIGSHSRRGILDVGLGGTTAAVVKMAKCPVLVAALSQ